MFQNPFCDDLNLKLYVEYCKAITVAWFMRVTFFPPQNFRETFFPPLNSNWGSVCSGLSPMVTSCGQWWKERDREYKQLKWFSTAGWLGSEIGWGTQDASLVQLGWATQNALERLHFWTGLGTPQHPPRGAAGTGQEENRLGFPTKTASPATRKGGRRRMNEFGEKSQFPK